MLWILQLSMSLLSKPNCMPTTNNGKFAKSLIIRTLRAMLISSGAAIQRTSGAACGLRSLMAHGSWQ